LLPLCHGQGKARRIDRDRDRDEMVRAYDEHHGGYSGGTTRTVVRVRVVCLSPSPPQSMQREIRYPMSTVVAHEDFNC
jgi:hypothetical protein